MGAVPKLYVSELDKELGLESEVGTRRQTLGKRKWARVEGAEVGIGFLVFVKVAVQAFFFFFFYFFFCSGLVLDV